MILKMIGCVAVMALVLEAPCSVGAQTVYLRNNSFTYANPSNAGPSVWTLPDTPVRAIRDTVEFFSAPSSVYLENDIDTASGSCEQTLLELPASPGGTYTITGAVKVRSVAKGGNIQIVVHFSKGFFWDEIWTNPLDGTACPDSAHDGCTNEWQTACRATTPSTDWLPFSYTDTVHPDAVKAVLRIFIEGTISANVDDIEINGQEEPVVSIARGELARRESVCARSQFPDRSALYRIDGRRMDVAQSHSGNLSCGVYLRSRTLFAINK